MAIVLTIANRLRNPRLLFAVGFALGSLFVFLTVRGIDWTEVQAQVAETSPIAIVVALAITLISGFLRALRWRLLWVTEQVTTRRLFVVEMSSLGLNNLSPVRFLDEPAILTMLTVRDKLSGPIVVATVLMTRVHDMALTLAFGAVAVALEPGVAERAGAAVYVSGFFMIVLLGLLNLGSLARRFTIIGQVPGILAYGRAVEEVLTRKARLIGTSSLTGVYWLALGPAAYVLANGMGVEITLFQATIVALGATFFATAMPGLPGAFGTFELAVQELLTIWEVPRDLGFGFGVVLHLIFFVPPILFALVMLPREGVGIMRSWQRLAARHAPTEKRIRSHETP